MATATLPFFSDSKRFSEAFKHSMLEEEGFAMNRCGACTQVTCHE